MCIIHCATNLPTIKDECPNLTGDGLVAWKHELIFIKKLIVWVVNKVG